jgi:hypothetical protein
MNILSRLRDANIFVMQTPDELDGRAVIATLFPFDLNGQGYEARIYRLRPESLELSPAAAAAAMSGWGIDDISSYRDGALGVLEMSRDEEFKIAVRAKLPCVVEVKRKFLRAHPELGDAVPTELAKLLDETDVDWSPIPVTECA